MKTIAFIFARGNSEGVKNKNIKLLAGKPLIAYSIEMAQSISSISETYVSTDSEQIAQIALSFGSKVIERPSELASSTAPEWLAWRHAIEYLHSKEVNFDRFISLPTTSPLRDKSDVEKCLNKLDKETDIVITMSEAKRSPWFNMVIEKNSYVEIVMGKNPDINRRQDAPLCYDLTTVSYVSRPEYILSSEGIFSGRVKAVKIPAERAIDIDTEFDFTVAELLINKIRKEDLSHA